jgi:CelD/BcsL family acetyltransferase involved in cellulose biosynthesis
MMSAADYRAKARDAITQAEGAPDSKIKFHWEGIARDWAALAVQGDAHEALERTPRA